MIIKTVSGMTIKTEKESVARTFFLDGATVLNDDGTPKFTDNTIFTTNGGHYDVPLDPALENNCESCQ